MGQRIGESLEFEERIQNTWIIDTHSHPFRYVRLSPEHLAGLLAIGGPAYEGGEGFRDLETLLIYRFMLRELSKLLEVDGLGDPLKIMKKRSGLVERSFRDYVELLFRQARIRGLVIDDGYSEARGEHALPNLRIEEFEELLPRWISARYIHRIEPDVKRIFEESSTFTDFVADIEHTIEKFAKDSRYVGFKSIIAYRTGLDISWRDEDEARKEFTECKEKHCEQTWFGPVIRILREYVLSLVVERCRKYGKVVQIHTGIGDKDILLSKSFPHLLFQFLKDERTRKTKIVLVHGGYPNVAITSYLANAFPNVYMDISVATPFGLANLEHRIREALELAPASKIMYASDGYYTPELHWISAVALRKALISLLKEWLSLDLIDLSDALEIAERILYKNAVNVYSLEI
ncbi:MAG: amidohydrolase family protein [Ignisphaera sp.]|uniref:Amidohydrolase-related domain-containing protein n=1 Tax=Ignisphaera aggregans TaxID=334771 RepID=A0A7J3JQ04_9CREN